MRTERLVDSRCSIFFHPSRTRLLTANIISGRRADGDKRHRCTQRRAQTRSNTDRHAHTQTHGPYVNAYIRVRTHTTAKPLASAWLGGWRCILFPSSATSPPADHFVPTDEEAAISGGDAYRTSAKAAYRGYRRRRQAKCGDEGTCSGVRLRRSAFVMRSASAGVRE